MSKFVFMMELLLSQYVFIINGNLIKRVSVDDATATMFFWKADGEAFQFGREAISAAMFANPTHMPSSYAGDMDAAIIRDTTDKPCEFMALKNASTEFHREAVNRMWDYD